MKNSPNWQIVAEALSSLEFLRDIVEPEIQSKEVREVIAHHINAKNGIPPLNPGTLIAFAYIAIVYPKERAVFGLPGDLIAHQFTESTSSKTTSELLLKLRNSMSHGDFEVTDDRVYFHDRRRGWRADISHEALTVFLEDIFIKIVAQHYIGGANAEKNKNS